MIIQNANKCKFLGIEFNDAFSYSYSLNKGTPVAIIAD